MVYELTKPRRVLGYKAKSVEDGPLSGYAGTMAYPEKLPGTNYLVIVNLIHTQRGVRIQETLSLLDRPRNGISSGLY